MKPLQGFRDFFPEDLAIRNYIFDIWRRTARSYGFSEFDGPPLEELTLYTRKSGEEIVGQLYHFVDKGDREVALRPEMTPTLARMMAARASQLPKPIKWFSIPQVFRYERKQRGRLREHFQLNMDIIGATEVEADAELLSAALDVQRALGLSEKDVVERVNDRRLVAGVLHRLEVPNEKIPAVYAAIDKFRKVPELTFRDLLSDAGVPPAHIEELEGLCSKEISLFDWFRSGPKTTLPESMPALEALEKYLELFREVGLGGFVEVDFSVVRGLAYYTGIVFELYDRRGELRAICGGGRYDTLIASLGGPDLPALGFGMGDVVLTELLKDRGLLPELKPRVTVVVIPVGKELSGAARTVARLFRKAGIPVESPYSPAGVGKDLKAADQAGAHFAVIVGPDEWVAKEVKLKDLRSGKEERLSVERVVEAVRKLASPKLELDIT
ncbi:MAG: histidine--tRNA ligase [Vicinamibacteria bacterium]